MAAMLTRSIVTSGVASAATAAALMLLGRYEKRGALTPLNASSHWVYGDRAAQRHADLARTGLGIATHHLAVMFWSLVMESRWDERRGHCPNSRSAAHSRLALRPLSIISWCRGASRPAGSSR